MAIRIKLETKGFSDYLERVAAAGQNVDAATDAALQAGGEVLLTGMQQRVPKDTHNLESHLAIDGPKVDGAQHYIEVGLARDTDAETARYGNAQEYGTSSMAAQPYIRPTVDHDMARARKAMKQAFEDSLK